MEKKVVTDAFTVVISTWRGKRVPLDMLVALYRKVPHVHRIVVIWHDPATAPTIASEPSALVPLFVHRVETNSLNNRFLPLSAIETEGFLTVDDDILATPEDLAFGFSIWKRNPRQLAGPFLRSHVAGKSSPDGKKVEYAYSMKDRMQPRVMHSRVVASKYSMVLTKLLFAPTKLLFMFTCLMPRDIQAYIDSIMNCEDIAMSFLVANLTEKAAVWVRGAGIREIGSSGLSSNQKVHYAHRSDCVDHFTRLFGRMPLLVANQKVDRAVNFWLWR